MLIAAHPYEAEVLRRMVAAGGLRVVVADRGEAGMLFATESPSVVLLSLAPGAAPGLLERLRAATPRVPMIAIDDPDAAAGPGALASEVRLFRPIDPDLLVRKIGELVAAAPRRRASEPGWLYAGAKAGQGHLRAHDAMDDFDRTIPQVETLAGALFSFPDPNPLVDTLPAPAPTWEDPLAGIEDVDLTVSEVTGSAEPPGRAGGDVPQASQDRDLPDQGELATLGLPELLGRLHRARFTGRLLLRRAVGEKTILLDGGAPILAASTLPHDQLPDLLVREGRITREQQIELRAAAAGGARVTDLLLQLRMLDGDQLSAAVRRHAEEVLSSCFAWERGAFELRREALRRDKPVVLEAHAYAVARAGIRARYGLDRLCELVGPPSTEVVALPQMTAVCGGMGIAGTEWAVLRRLAEGPQSVASLAAAGLGEEEAYALVHALCALGGAARVPEPESRIDRSRLLAKQAQVRDGDYFSLLDIEPDATGEQIRGAWERLREEFAPARCAEVLAADLGTPLDEIAEVLDEAYRVLSDHEVRAAYRGHLAPRAS